MKDSLILEGKTYISARRAAKIINYAQDYVGQLCRSGKLDCKMVGRSWFVTEESLLAHRESAIDSTLDKGSKIAKKTPEISDAVASPIPSPVEAKFETIIPVHVEKIQALKYEPVTGSLLPELKKRVPSAFSLPRTALVPVSGSTIKSSSLPAFNNAVIILLIAAAVAGSGFIFTLFGSSAGGLATTSNSQASIISVTHDVLEKIFSGFGLRDFLASFFHKKGTDLSKNSGNKNSAVSGEEDPDALAGYYNGLGVVPSTSMSADEKEKAKIRNTFSDEVAIHPDQSGTAGVITPVFKETNGNDFVYVLVPVKDKKQQ